MGPSSQVPLAPADCMPGGVPLAKEFVGKTDPAGHPGHQSPGNSRFGTSQSASSPKEALEATFAPSTGHSSRASQSPATCMPSGVPDSDVVDGGTDVTQLVRSDHTPRRDLRLTPPNVVPSPLPPTNAAQAPQSPATCMPSGVPLCDEVDDSAEVTPSVRSDATPRRVSPLATHDFGASPAKPANTMQEMLEEQVAELRRDLALANDRIAELEQLEKLPPGCLAGKPATPSTRDAGIQTEPTTTLSACIQTGAPSGFEDLIDGDAGCEIRDTADRGITFSQLRQLATFIERHCSRLGWTSTKDQQSLAPHNMTFYDVAHHVIKPVTAHRACSYVEVVARQEQPPTWFVSHWWGQPVLLLVACLAQHAVDRQLRASTPYWVGAYADSQHCSHGDIAADPGKSCFRRAMASTVGTISVVDRNATCFKRVWCIYEVWVAMDPMASASTYKYDVYTALDPTRAVGFTDGLAEADIENGRSAEWRYVGGAHAHKEHREATFPADVVRRAFEVKLHEAAATEETDRRRILNAIAGRGLDMEPLADHKTYTSVNQAFKWRIGLAAHAMIDRGDVPGVQLDSLEVPQAWAGRAAAAYLPLCRAYTALGRYPLARLFGERAVTAAEGAKDEDVAEACVAAGQATYRNANFAEALSLFDRALAIRERSVGREHPDVAAVLHEKGWCYFRMREHERSLNLYEEALAIRKAALGGKHLAVGQTLNCMGALLRNMGEPARALSLYDEALAVCREVLGDKDPYVGGMLSNIAGVLQDMGEFARALSLYEEAFVVKKGACGKHPRVAATMTNMAILLTEMGERARALSLYDEALAVKKEALGDKHPDVGMTLNKMAALHQHAGRHAQAAECYEDASHVYALAYGEDDSGTADVRAKAAAARLQAESAR